MTFNFIPCQRRNCLVSFDILGLHDLFDPSILIWTHENLAKRHTSVQNEVDKLNTPVQINPDVFNSYIIKPRSPQVLRRTASDSFLTITYYMLLDKTQESLQRLLHQIEQEIPQVVEVADGTDTAQLMRRYLIEGDLSVTLQHVTTAKLINFVSRYLSSGNQSNFLARFKS